MSSEHTSRRQVIIDSLEQAFADLMKRDPRAFRTKFRKMAADPFAFYRGSACLFYADVALQHDPWADERTSRVWIHGDLHRENFGTAMNGRGELVFDVNDFDEAYVGHFSWDLRRFVASLALLGWQKALPTGDVEQLARVYLTAYLERVRDYVEGSDDGDFALRVDNAQGVVLGALKRARAASRTALLDALTVVEDDQRRFRDGGMHRRLDPDERARVMAAYEEYVRTVPRAKREGYHRSYEAKDVVGVSGFGIGSAGLRAYSILAEGYDEALESDVVLSMKQGLVPAVSRVVDVPEAGDFFDHQGHRTALSQLALQVHADPFLGWSTIDGEGYVVDELSPYELDLDWDDLTEPEDIAVVVRQLGQATAKIHCVSDQDSPQTLVDFQTETAILAAVDGRQEEFVDDLTRWGVRYAEQVRSDHAEFVSAFREGLIGGLTSTARAAG